MHVWGQACDVRRLEKIAESNGLRLYFDAAPALGCTHNDTPIGGFGDAEVFSFHATKIVNSFEGGAIVTDDDALAERMRAVRNFGFGPDGRVGHIGTNAKLNEAAAAMGLTSLDALADTMIHNRANYELYRAELAGIPGVRPVEYASQHRNNHHYMMITVDEAAAGCTGTCCSASCARRGSWPSPTSRRACTSSSRTPRTRAAHCRTPRNCAGNCSPCRPDPRSAPTTSGPSATRYESPSPTGRR